MAKKHKSGQVVLIVLLIMVVVLTIGLSLISQSVTDISISKDEQEAIRAFSAAEAGIEAALQNIGTAPTTVEVDGITANIAVSDQNNDIDFSLAEGEYLDLDLSGVSSSTMINLEWNTGAAIETAFYYTTTSTRRFIYRSNSASCLSGSSITVISGDPVELELDPIDWWVNDVQFLRIRAICSAVSLNLTVSGDGGTFPSQVQQVDSRASEDGKTSAIQVTRTDELPSVFDYVLFSKGDVSHSDY